MKVHEFETIVKKLGMETRDSSERHAWLEHGGAVVVRTRRSHGNSKYMPEHKIRTQLKVNESEFAGLISCSVTKQQYLSILTDKGIIRKVTAGQTFRAGDGGIEVTVLRVGSVTEKARFHIKNLTGEKATYTITVHRRSGGPDRIDHKTDDPKHTGQHELSADETTGIQIRREKR